MLYLMYCMYCFLCFTKPLALSPPQILQPFEENSAQRCCRTCRGSNPPIVHIVLSIPLAERRPGSHTSMTGRYIHCMAVFLAKWRPFLQKIVEKFADQLKTTAILFFVHAHIDVKMIYLWFAINLWICFLEFATLSSLYPRAKSQ